MNSIEQTQFAMEAVLIRMELRKILGKIQKIEDCIIQEIRSQVSEEDFYKPDTEIEEPPKKRVKKE
jgi:hypothetical protein